MEGLEAVLQEHVTAEVIAGEWDKLHGVGKGVIVPQQQKPIVQWHSTTRKCHLRFRCL